MEKKINIAELLKDCPKGMELDCVMYENVFFDCVTNNPIYPIRLYVQSEKDSITLTSFGWTTPSPYAKCVIFPKGKTTWRGFVPPCKFKVGDRVRNKNYKDYIYDIHDIVDKGYRAKEMNSDSPIIILFGSQEDNYELVPNKFDIATLKPFESEVLVRDADGDLWKPAIYGFSHQKGCYVVGGVYWRQCIPYEVNKELLGTTNNIE